MTTIPNLNVVVQQGHKAIEAQNVRNPAQESNLASVLQPEKEDTKRTTVQEFEESDHVQLDSENSGGKGKNPRKREKRKKAKAPAEKPREGSGRLLDTIA
jgi:hypothetical protein